MQPLHFRSNKRQYYIYVFKSTLLVLDLYADLLYMLLLFNALPISLFIVAYRNPYELFNQDAAKLINNECWWNSVSISKNCVCVASPSKSKLQSFLYSALMVIWSVYT